MSERKFGLELIKISGYHNNSDWIRIYTEYRISYKAAQEAYRTGWKLRQAGVKCTCKDCNK